MLTETETTFAFALDHMKPDTLTILYWDFDRQLVEMGKHHRGNSPAARRMHTLLLEVYNALVRNFGSIEEADRFLSGSDPLDYSMEVTD